MMKELDYLPKNYDAIKIVNSWDELLTTEFGDASCILYPRTLAGDFNALASVLRICGKDLPKHAPEEIATEHALLMADIDRVKSYFKSINMASTKPEIRLEQTNTWDPFSSINKWHADGCINADFGRLLCNYNTPVTEWLRQGDVKSIPWWRKNEGFIRRPFTKIYSFQPGDVWRQRSILNVDEDLVPREKLFIHRRPKAVKKRHRFDPPRLLMVAG